MKQRNPDKYIKESSSGFEVRVTCEMKLQYFERRRRGIASRGEARFIANQFLDEREEFRSQVRSGQVSWSTAIIEWTRYAESKNYSASTIHSAKLTLEKHTQTWNKRPVSSITTEEVELLIHSNFSEAQTETKRSLLKHIRGVFNRQVQLAKIKHNPTNGIYLGPKPDKEKKVMTRNEIVTLLKKAKEENHPWYPVWRITYELGLRAGEAYALRWEDISFDSGFVVIKQSYNNKAKAFKAPKNNRFRSLPLNYSLKEFLLDLKSKSEEREFVFERNLVWSHGEQAKVLREFQKHIGIQQTNFHSLRASFITHLLLAGVPLLKVKEMVGHKRTETTELYMASVAADKIGATDAIEIKD